MCDGIVSQILSPRYKLKSQVKSYLRLSEPWFTVFTFGIINCDLFLKLYWSACLKEKRSCKISSEIPRCTLYILIPRILRFLWCMEKDLPLRKRLSEDDFLSLYIKRRHLSYVLVIYFIIFCASMTHSNQWTIIELRHEERIH